MIYHCTVSRHSIAAGPQQGRLHRGKSGAEPSGVRNKLSRSGAKEPAPALEPVLAASSTIRMSVSKPILGNVLRCQHVKE